MANVTIAALSSVTTLAGTETMEVDTGVASKKITVADLTTAIQNAIANLNAAVLTGGTVPDARFPATLPALSGVNLTALNASNLGSGTIPDAVFPAALPALSGVNLTALNASNLGSGTIPDARFPATLPALNGVNLTALNANNISGGVVATARLGSGSADATHFLRGDQTWAVPVSIPGNDVSHDFGAVGSGTSTHDYGSYSDAKITIAGASTYAISNPAASGIVTLVTTEVVQDGVHVITWPAAYAFGSIGAPPAGTNGNLILVTAYSRDGGVSYVASWGALDAAQLVTGTVPDARFPATLPALSGVNLTALNATNLSSGTVPDARFPATLPALSGVNLTALNASNLGSGTVPDARFPATLPALSGVNLTALNGTNIASGTVADARLPATMAGKTLNAPSYQKTVPTISAGTLALDYNNGPWYAVSLNANITTLTITNWPTSGTAGIVHIVFTADGTGRTVVNTIGGVTLRWEAGTAPTLPTTSGHEQVWTLQSSDALATKIRAFVSATEQY